MLLGLFGARPPWQWRLGSSSAATADHLAAAAAALRRQGRKAAAGRAAVVAHLAAAADPSTPGSAVAVQQMARCADLMDALADALHPSALPSQELIEVGGGGSVLPACCILLLPAAPVAMQLSLKSHSAHALFLVPSSFASVRSSISYPRVYRVATRRCCSGQKRR